MCSQAKTDPPTAPRNTDRVTINQLTTAVLLFDHKLNLIDINLAAEALLEISAKVALGMDPADLLPGAPAFSAAVRRVSQTGEPLAEREMPLGNPAADASVADCLLTPMSESETPCGVLVEFLPIERLRRISREEQLLAQNEAVRLLVRGLAHEIKNPLGGLRGAAQLLESELEDPGLAEYTQVIIGEADRLQALVDRMLAPRAVPALERSNVHEVTERVWSLINAEAPLGVVVDRDYDPSIPEIEIDADLLIQALLNVARNGVQALGSHGRLSIRTRVARNLTIGQRQFRLGVKIMVHDNGPGVPPDLIEQVFYPLVSGRSEGTGLGLSIAQSLVNQQGGLIECHSQPGDTTFCVLIPVRE